MKKFFAKFNKFDKVVFLLCLFISIILLTMSFLIPPTGQIDPSVLAAVGEIFGFSSLAVVIVALGRGADVNLHKGDIDISLNNPDTDKDEDK